MKVDKKTVDKLAELYGTLDSRGHEIPDPNPMEIPAGFRRPETLQEQIKRILRVELSMQAQNQGYETFEEANDFEVEDEDPLPESPYELKAIDELPVMSPDKPEKETSPPTQEIGGEVSQQQEQEEEE